MTDPNLDKILQVLADHHRRQAIQILRQTPDDEIGVEELLDELIRRTGQDEDIRDHVAVQMHHNHLPKLAEKGLIAYNQDARHVRYRPDKKVEAVMDGIVPQVSPSIHD